VPQSISEPASAAGGPISHAIFRLARLHKELAGQLLRDIGLYPGQELLLMQLWDGGTQRQVDVGRLLDSDAATITRSVRRLERAGLVRRTRNAADKRSVLIEATPESEPLRLKVEAVWGTLEQLTVKGMTRQQRAEALRALKRLEENVAASR
jgi:MarR family transcriptional regulator, organic hydroperoxide resistance regulator